MYYLSACNRGPFKSYYCYVLFLPFEICLYVVEKNYLLTNIRNKCVIKRIFFFFLTSWKMAKFFLQKFFIFNTIVDSFLEEKQGTVELARRYVCKNLLNLDCQDSTRCGIHQVAYKWRITYEEFLLPIFCKMFDRNFRFLFSKTFKFIILYFVIS